jgi:hypothetical protein
MLDFFRISSITDDAIIKRKGFIFSERQTVKTSWHMKLAEEMVGGDKICNWDFKC